MHAAFVKLEQSVVLQFCNSVLELICKNKSFCKTKQQQEKKKPWFTAVYLNEVWVHSDSTHNICFHGEIRKKKTSFFWNFYRGISIEYSEDSFGAQKHSSRSEGVSA